MSYLLKTAAMSLLSKTLQTFLYKYLSDVDVEGVALPSVYDGSGWGVRLSNVKLRDGVQLMEQMPGKRKKSRQRQRHKQDTQKTEEQQQEQQQQEQQEEAIPKQQQQQQQEQQNNTEQKDELDVSIRVEDLEHSNEKNVGGTYYDDDENEGRPSTPTQDSKSMFSCFSARRGGSKSKILLNTPSSSELSLPHLNGTNPPDDVVAKEDAQFLHSTQKEKHPEQENHEEESKAEDTTSLSSQVATTVTKTEETEISSEEEKVEETKDKEEDEEGDDAYTEDEEEYEDYEQPMMLCLGENGSIGTLDIRLIGKELHVMVEDAVLTIEAIPIPEKSDETTEVAGDDNGGEKVADTAEDGTSTASQAPKDNGGSESETKSKPAEGNRATVGERVLADNPLARAISAIPHLFLRDIHIRLVIRDEPTSIGAETTAEPLNPKDSMLEIGIEFLSVTSGGDIFSHFQEQMQQQNGEELDESSSHRNDENYPAPPKEPMTRLSSFSNVDAALDQNEYLVRHVRTGRGPEAGIWLQVFAPSPKLPSSSEGGGWARQHWIAATEFHFLRCSGLDLRARIHLGTKKEVAGYSWFYGDDDDDEYKEYDEFTLDSMLFGLDHVAPGPQLPLPPITPSSTLQNAPQLQGEDEANEFVGGTSEAEVYHKDQNGIQSCKVSSSFHRVARGMYPGSCKNCTHLPSEVCPDCWEGGDAEPSSLDESIPMPGLTLQMTFRDQLEINVDRTSLETIGLLNSLFQRKPSVEAVEEASDDETKADPNVATEASATPDETSSQTTASTSYFSALLPNKIEEEIKEDPSDSFALYMQPENVQVMGIHLSEMLLRVHVLQGDKHDVGLAFSYWELSASCLTMDQHSLKSPKKKFQDLELDIGHLTWEEYSGTTHKPVCSLGIPYPETRRRLDSGEASIASLVAGYDQEKTPWPSTACVLLDIPPPLETLVYQGRERHGLQLRFRSLDDPTNQDEASRSHVFARLGSMNLAAPYGFWREFFRVYKNAVSCIKETPNEESSIGKKASKADDSSAPRPKSLMKYSVQMDGGRMVMDPLMNVKLPLTHFSGEKSSESGFFLETILNKMRFAYGKTEEPNRRGFSLQRLAALPENIRLRILLCLEDLGPLEQALELKEEKNSFRRCRSVNKGIVKIAKKLARSSKSSRKKSSRGDFHSTRRQEIMTELMKLDDNELDELWSVHQKHLKKVAKKKSSQSLNS